MTREVIHLHHRLHRLHPLLPHLRLPHLRLLDTPSCRGGPFALRLSSSIPDADQVWSENITIRYVSEVAVQRTHWRLSKKFDIPHSGVKEKKITFCGSQSIASSISRRDAHALPEQRRPLAIWAILRSVCKHRDIWMPVSLICSSKWYFKKAF